MDLIRASLVLWRHAEAEDEASSDMARDLTARGRQQAHKMAQWFGGQIDHQWSEWVVLVSPANRAQQTAAALAQPFQTIDMIAPDAPADAVIAAAAWPCGVAGRSKVLVVGHQPTLGMVAARLIDGADGHVSVKKGAMWWFETRERGGSQRTVLRAMVTPETV